MQQPKKVVVSCALNGVLTDPKKFNVPVTPEQLAESAEEAYKAGATIVHVHFRDQRPGLGHLPTWDPEVAKAVGRAIRERCPRLLINMTTGTFGSGGPAGGGDLGPTGGPISCLDAMLPEMAAMNSGSLNYLKTTNSGSWAWPPLLFDNPVEKVSTMIEAMVKRNIIPECECFDTGIVRSIKMYEQVGILPKPYQVSFVMGVASGMPAKPDWLPLLVQEIPKDTHWQVIAIGRKEVWPLLRKAAEIGGHVRTGLEDTFYLPSGMRATSNGELIAALVQVCKEAGREIATPEDTAQFLKITPDRKPKSLLLPKL
eukprot:TRINITY_DN27150_c0_g1_i1.p1 TRINITY_DN27150_c0_g1~~TRINITY_DN27150_c0_g1_i1.p1  ORF type:complete len:313 (-),score=51.24 TRINITY_DN27150_c0_g1_i1:15-953(-)